MISKFFNGGKVLHAVALTAMLSTQLFAGVGSVSSNADRYPGLGTLFPAFGGSAEFKSARLYTDKASYLASDTVRINGEGFDGFERVRFAVGSENKDGTSALVIAQWDVYADGKGRVETTWDVPSSDTFTVTATGDVSGLTGKIEINPEAESVKLAQCANSNADPQNLDCPSGGPAGWVTGLVGASKSRYFEGQFIAYRNVMEGLTPGDSYKWTVIYDVTKAGLNAIDYLGTYNASITNANPCADGANANGFCTQGPATSTLAIPLDPKVGDGRDQIDGNADDITQIPGVMSAWGGTITAVTVPTYTGPFPVGDESASVDITFTAGASGTVVLAWGGHISTRSDWGETFGSVNISGAPYHTSNGGLMNLTANTTCCGGSQDLQLAEAAVLPTAKLTIVKQAAPASSFVFGFNASSIFAAGDSNPFSLVDSDSSTTNQDVNNTKVFDGITYLGVVKTITETSPAPYTLTSASCVDEVGGGAFQSNLTGLALTLTLNGGDDVTCTFFNDFTTGAEATIVGRVVDPYGNPLSNAWVSATDSNGTTVTARTNQFGRYTLTVEAGLSLFMDVAHKRFTFGSQLINVNDDTMTVNFTGVAR